MFSKKLETIKCPDPSGEISSQRFQYQVACVFLMLLTLYKKTQDFYILLDYIDDFVIIENQNTDKEIINFVQVKTQKGKPISISTVVKKEWILKQSNNFKQFIDENVKNILMTNLGISFNQKIVDDTELVSLENCKGYPGLEKLREQMKNNGFDTLDNFYLIKASISIDAIKEGLKGKLHEYVLDNHFMELTADSIEAIYQKIWQDLWEKQTYVPNGKEAKDYEAIILKKGIKYSYIKTVFNLMADIQLPEKGKVSKFCEQNNIFLNGYKFHEFGSLFKEFRIDSAKNGMSVLQECFVYLKDKEDELSKDANNKYEFSRKAFCFLCSDLAVCKSEFFKKYGICIAVFYTYKWFEF